MVDPQDRQKESLTQRPSTAGLNIQGNDNESQLSGLLALASLAFIAGVVAIYAYWPQIVSFWQGR